MRRGREQGWTVIALRSKVGFWWFVPSLYCGPAAERTSRYSCGTILYHDDTVRDTRNSSFD